jgi:ABC-type polar amino acid transport system ATPase subunit
MVPIRHIARSVALETVHLYRGTRDEAEQSAHTLTSKTELHGRVVNIPASYSGGPGFKSLPRDPS